eukprot:911526-Rhodomonas_salina.1
MSLLGACCRLSSRSPLALLLRRSSFRLLLLQLPRQRDRCRLARSPAVDLENTLRACKPRQETAQGRCQRDADDAATHREEQNVGAVATRHA